jgi:hypothetical protein
MRNSEVQIGNSGPISWRRAYRSSKCGQPVLEATHKTRSCNFHRRAAGLQGVNAEFVLPLRPGQSIRSVPTTQYLQTKGPLECRGRACLLGLSGGKTTVVDATDSRRSSPKMRPPLVSAK